MIAFDCARCGMKFKVKDEFAGRATRCSTCKQPLVVPAFDGTACVVPTGAIDVAASSVALAGIQGEVTLKADVPDHPGQASVVELLARRPAKGQRYVLDNEIARGGMGAVLRAVDCDIRREVAVKYLLRQSDAHSKARFVEEAQIAGQLEHPNIVPIHELGVDGQGRMFFTMKMVRGRSLAQVLDELRKDTAQGKDWPLARLLSIIVNVCHALAYAHGRGVVHRDLKPANVMVGEFGAVYVMDWGLAKVLHESAAPVAQAAANPRAQALTQPTVTATPVAAPPGWSATLPVATPVAASGSGSATGKVLTSRHEADLTQEGAVLGTPVYMAPEQALGKIHDVGRRSDVYSLGAILYEVLTLQPPISKEGGYPAILRRVSLGEIVPPEERVWRAGSVSARSIPPELSAVALKALARAPQDRYQTVEELRRDIERFQEGRSVSAKHDTAREQVWKFVKRNQAVSGVAAAAVLALLVVFGHGWWTNRQARLATEEAYATSLQEQREKEKRTRRAVPAFVHAARQVAGEGEFEKALTQVDFALEYEPSHAEARLLKGQILIARKDFTAGRTEVDQYLRQRPADADAQKLAELCRAKTDDLAFVFALVDVFQRQGVFALARPFLRDASRQVAARSKLLPVYRKQIEAAWPGRGKLLTLATDGQFSLALNQLKEVTGLQPLRGMPLNQLVLGNLGITDLSPLHGMPLTWLNLGNCKQLRDLSPLQGMPLTALNLGGCVNVSNLAPLQGMPLTELSLYGCDNVSNLAPVKGMPLTKLDLHDCRKVGDLSPIAGMKITALSISSSRVKDLAPLRGMTLTFLNFSGCDLLHDLSPLQGMPLTSLGLDGCRLVHDLSPLKGMPLTDLTMYPSGVRDLTPLDGARLLKIELPESIERGMSVLRRMESLVSINRMPAAEFWKKYTAGQYVNYKD